MIELFKQGNLIILFALCFTVLFIWTYKELRKTVISKKEKKTQILFNLIELHTKCLYYLKEYKFNRIPISTLNETLFNILNYSDSNLTELILSWNENDPNNKIIEITDLIEKNLRELKAKKNYTPVNRKYTFTIENIFFSINKHDLDTFLLPLFNTIFLFSIILFVFLLIYPSSVFNGYTMALYLFIILTLVVYFVILFTSIDIFEAKKEKKTRTNIILLLLLIIIGFITVITMNLLIFILWITFTWLYCLIVFRKLIK
jgi:hypothetical protein